jgi:hypothetical protein
MRRSFLVVLAVSALVLVWAPPAAAAPPNDSQSTAVEVPSIPFTYEQDTTGANGNGPRFCSNNTSVFFRFTSSDTARVQVDTIGSDYDTVLSIYTRDGGVNPVRCNDDRFGLASGDRFRAHAGQTYYIMVAQCCGNGDSYGGGNLVLRVDAVPTAPLQATLEVSATGTYDPVGGSATIGARLTCSTPAFVGLDGILRQVRSGLYLARGYASWYALCEPGTPVEWSIEVDSETSYAFGSGDARLTYWAGASDGFNQGIVLAEQRRVTISLQSGSA